MTSTRQGTIATALRVCDSPESLCSFFSHHRFSIAMDRTTKTIVRIFLPRKNATKDANVTGLSLLPARPDDVSTMDGDGGLAYWLIPELKNKPSVRRRRKRLKVLGVSGGCEAAYATAMTSHGLCDIRVESILRWTKKKKKKKKATQKKKNKTKKR